MQPGVVVPANDETSELTITVHYRREGVVDDEDRFGVRLREPGSERKISGSWGKGRCSPGGVSSSGGATVKDAGVTGFDVALDLKWKGPQVGQGECHETFRCAWTAEQQVFRRDGFEVTVEIAEPTYTYTMKPSLGRTGDRLEAWMEVRRNGESYTTIYYEIPPDSRWRKIFEDAAERDKTEEIFFEARFSREVPPPRMSPFGFHMGISTEQTRDDLKAFGSSIIRQSIDNTGLLEMRFITENEYLGETPRIVPDPGK